MGDRKWKFSNTETSRSHVLLLTGIKTPGRRPYDFAEANGYSHTPLFS